jgi:hypothetical protein
MARSFSAGSVVRLPRLNALTTARLLHELLTAAGAESKLPAWLALDVAELTDVASKLDAELTRRLQGGGKSTPVVAAADRVEDTAFTALFDWLTGWSLLRAEHHPEALGARAALDAIFSQGRSFLALRPVDEWQEAELRLQLIADKGHGAAITQLGGKPFLDELRAAHAAYGEALGITTIKPTPEPPRLRAARDAAAEVVRGYVMRVSGHVRAKDPTTRALADRLLAPLVNWRDVPTQPSPVEPEPEPSPAA